MSLSSFFEVNLSAVVANYALLDQLSGPGVALAAVLKSDAYGLGLEAVGKALIQAGCRSFIVADLTEAMRLRTVSRGCDIMVLRDDVGGNIDVYRQQRFTAVVNDAAELAVLERSGQQPYALFADTGFSRFGFDWSEVRRLYLRDVFAKRRPDIVLSHLGCADIADHPENTLQRNRFVAVCRLLQPRIRSLSASAGLWLDPGFHFDMVRCGSALYGLNNARLDPNPLHTVVRLRARIVGERVVERGEAVGYGATFVARRRMRVGVLGIGYANGLPWSASNRFAVQFSSLWAPVIGRIAMEYTTIDLTDLPPSLVHPGCWADIVNERFTIDDLAGACGTNAQEILLRLGSNGARRYVRQALPENRIPPEPGRTIVGDSDRRHA